VEENVHEEAVQDAEAEGFEQVDSEGYVFARSSGEVDDEGLKDAEVDPQKKSYLEDEAAANRLHRQEQFRAEPDKDESVAVPMQSPLQTAPERHAHSTYEDEVKDSSVDDADFDAEEKKEQSE
jgi:hypothetical protein